MPLAQEWVFVAAPLIGAIIAVGIWMILSYTYKADESVKEIVE